MINISRVTVELDILDTSKKEKRCFKFKYSSQKTTYNIGLNKNEKGHV